MWEEQTELRVALMCCLFFGKSELAVLIKKACNRI